MRMLADLGDASRPCAAPHPRPGRRAGWRWYQRATRTHSSRSSGTAQVGQRDGRGRLDHGSEATCRSARSCACSGVRRARGLLWHGLDVAAVGAVLLQRRPSLSARLGVVAGGEKGRRPGQVLALLALHDIGKLTRPFQAKVPGLWPISLLGLLPPDHGATGLRLLLALDHQHGLGLFEG
jgi:hypothetical protein